MGIVLAISSSVSCEAIGLTATHFALERLGHEMWGFATITLSNHPGRVHKAGTIQPVERLDAMLTALDANGFLGQVDAVVTGYMPTPGHVSWAVEAVTKVRQRNPKTIVVCDPIMGDDGTGLYIDEAAAAMIRDKLVPISDVLTPNRFELSWLTGLPSQTRREVADAMKILAPELIVTTSVPQSGDMMDRAKNDAPQLANIMKSPDGFAAVSVERHEAVPHGTGDFFAALFLAKSLSGAAPTAALGFAVHACKIAITSQTDKDRFEIVSSQDKWAKASALDVEQV